MTQATAPAPERREQAALVAFDAELARRREVLEASAASLIDPDRLRVTVLASFSRNPALWECDPVTVARAVVEAAQLGLEPTGAIGGAHLVPFKNTKSGKREAQLIIDYRGYVQLARRSGEVSKVWARVVRERDEFGVEAGTADRLIHRPYLGTEDPGNITHVYAVIAYRDGSQQFDWDTRAWVETIRKRSKASDNGPWVTDYAEMSKKSILRRLLKTAPLTVEARRAIELEEHEEAEVAARPGKKPDHLISSIQSRLGVSAPVEEEAKAPEAAETQEATFTEEEEAELDAAASAS